MYVFQTISKTKTGYSEIIETKRIVSLLDMLQVEARGFLASLTYISGFLSDHKSLMRLHDHSLQFVPTNPIEQRAHLIKSIETLQHECERHGLHVSQKLAKDAHTKCFEALAGETWSHPHNLRKVTVSLEGLLNTVISEAESRPFYVLGNSAPEGHDKADTLFGSRVIDAFPDAEFDISEAGRCLSFGLSTACVMHTMRVLETGLIALAKHVGVEAGSNWNKTLNEMELALRQINARTNGRDAEQWAAEAGTHLRFIKNAFRNRAMHHIAQYSDEKARSIFSDTRDFMQHLAEKIESAPE